MRKKNFAAVLTALSAAAAISLAFAPAPEPGAGEQERVTQQRVRVLYNVTDVVVKDADGDFVTGLDADDFTLEVDGQQMEIRSVDEFAAPAQDDERIVAYMRTLERSRQFNTPPPPTPTPPRYVVIVFDRFYMGNAAMREAKEVAKQIVTESLLPYDRVGVFQYNRSMRTLTGPTSDRERIMAAIDSAGGASNNPTYQPQPADLFLPQRDEEYYDLRSRLFLKESQFNNFIDSIRYLARGLEVLPGRKTYLLFSDGPDTFNPIGPDQIQRAYQQYENETMMRFYRDKVSTLTNYLSQISVQHAIQELAREMTSTNASVYTIRCGPVQPEWALMAEASLADARSSSNRFLTTDVQSLVNDIETNRIDTLRTTASNTNGKHFDAGMPTADLLRNVRQEVGNYYLIGYSPPERESGRFHSLTVRCRVPEYRVEHRDGFFDTKLFSEMSGKERAIHLEEGFLVPGIRNELDMLAGGFALPVSGGRLALVSFSINSAKVEPLEDGGREIEYVLNLEDRQGQIRYRTHKLLRLDGSEGLPSRLWLNLRVPLIDDVCAAYLAVRDNASGQRSTWRRIFGPGQRREGVIETASPLMLSTDRSGALASWSSEDAGDDVEAVDEPELIEFSFEARPLLSYTVAQGQSVGIVMMLGNMPGSFDPAQSEISVNFALDASEDTSYLLNGEDVRIQFMSDQRILMISARVPVGLAQRPTGTLSVAIGGLTDGGQVLVAALPYRVDPFSPGQAQQHLGDPRITPMD